MKRKSFKIILCIVLVLAIVGASVGAYLWWRISSWPGTPDDLKMHTDFSRPQNLPDGGGKRIKVILLLGQSNATGVGHVEYLKKNVTAEQYARYESGFDSVRINYCVDNHANCSNGEFVSVNLGCSANTAIFGPEVGMADRFATEWGEEEVVILKYSYSGTSLYSQWLAKGERGAIYRAMREFVDTYMNALRENGYDARLGAICWMQGESDSVSLTAKSRYYKAQTNFVSYMRSDFAEYAEESGICFIDAGISNSYLWVGYKTINAAKEKMAGDSELNYYFSTIEEGLTYNREPEENPDLAHYDSLSTLKLGHLFGEYVIRAYNEHNAK